MGNVRVTTDVVEVRLSGWEKVASVRGDLQIPRKAVWSAQAVEGLAGVSGLRAAGLAVTGLPGVGTWRGVGARRFVVVRPGRPALVLHLSGYRYDLVAVSMEHPEDVVAALDVPVASELTFTSDGATLSGTLVLSETPSRGPGVLLLTGSGPMDRDGNQGRLRLDVSRQLARALATAGVASLRYDKRGVGVSEGSFLESGLADNINDACAALKALSEHPQIDPAELYIVGHSEGAIIAAAVAASDMPLAGVVLVACPGRTGECLLVWQAERLEDDIPPPVRGMLWLLRTDLVSRIRRNHQRIKQTTTDVARIGGVRINARWHREFMKHDPRRDLARIDVPVLAITGENDLQVPAEDLAVIAAMVPGPVQTWMAPDLSHILRRQYGPPSLRSYRKDAKRPVDSEVLDRIVQWVHHRPGQPDRHGSGTRR